MTVEVTRADSRAGAVLSVRPGAGNGSVGTRNTGRAGSRLDAKAVVVPAGGVGARFGERRSTSVGAIITEGSGSAGGRAGRSEEKAPSSRDGVSDVTSPKRGGSNGLALFDADACLNQLLASDEPAALRRCSSELRKTG